MICEFPLQVQSFICNDLVVQSNTERHWQLVCNKLQIVNLIMADHETIAEDAVKMSAPKLILSLFQQFIELSPESKEVRENLPRAVIHAFRLFLQLAKAAEEVRNELYWVIHLALENFSQCMDARNDFVN